jgi:hypothetical protein
VQEVNYQNQKKAEISHLQLVNVAWESEERRVTVCGETKGQKIEQKWKEICVPNDYSAFVME